MASSSPPASGKNSSLSDHSDGTSVRQLRTSARRSTEYVKTEQQQQPQQQEDGLTCDEYYMALAFLSAKRSKEPSTQKVGACIVKDKQILSTGYDGMPTGCHDDQMPWGRKGSALNTKHMFVCHAEMNAILNKNAADVRGAEMHVVLFPCVECAKLIIRSGIASVVYYYDDNGGQYPHKSKLMFESNGVECKKYDGKIKHFTLDFDQNDIRINPTSPTTSPSFPPFDRDRPWLCPACINWDEYFMAVAFLAAQCSEGPQEKVGACLVNSDLRIVGIGFDTLILTEASTDERVHAVVNAILNKNCSDVHECSFYVTSFPCNECAKVIVQAGITKVTYFSGNNDYEKTAASKMIFDLATVKYFQFSSSLSLNTKITLNFNSVIRKN